MPTGGEADFVVLSMVRSLPKSRIIDKPSRRWRRDNVGFVCDRHQINVALTRSKHGLIVIGKFIYN